MRRSIGMVLLAIGASAGAQTTPRGWELNALPAINYNSDEGFGYGVTAQAFQYGNGTYRPYAYTIQPLIFLTTAGRKELSVFFDGPHVIPGDWRISGYLGYEKHTATPFYGIGNNTPYNKSFEENLNKYFYRFARRGIRYNTDVQHAVAGPLSILAGIGLRTLTVDPEPFDSGTTLLSTQTGAAEFDGQASYARAGLVFDTRDEETGPTHGQWIEGLVQRAGKVAGGTNVFTRISGTARFYIPINHRVVWAQRAFAQNLSGDVPFYELYPFQGSLREDEGLGGARTVRGLPKNRYIGKGVAYFNEEVRWNAWDFQLRHRESSVVLNAFADAGRVWETGLSLDGLFEDYHPGLGGGARLRYGANFVVGVDIAHSKEGTPFYIGLGYLF